MAASVLMAYEGREANKGQRDPNEEEREEMPYKGKNIDQANLKWCLHDERGRRRKNK